MDKAMLRNIPKVDELLAPTHALCPDASAAAVTAAVRRTLDALRESVLSGEAPEIPETAALCALPPTPPAGRKRPRSVRSSTQPASYSIRISAAPV